ncbi:hypothetical protein KIN20_023059 [Parelaphostrongylus tenuis]|uniref:Uncharacterized protein n=1 Tax=Parelaphostrongylus tenuis TaxID=148309 RepID=A0AAD5QVS9_PARTN|nr:hypothetical protein KIN20_023059 [Parelaphostrongylus tenuis]
MEKASYYQWIIACEPSCMQDTTKLGQRDEGEWKVQANVQEGTIHAQLHLVRFTSTSF